MTIVNELDKDDYQNMREDLLTVRQRNVGKTPKSDDLDQILHHNEDVQQKLTSDMLTLTKNLKEQSELAKKIIRKDIDVLTRSSVLTDQNKAKLEVESSKLEENSRKAWKCWMWVILLVVMVVFMKMVLFMKVMKKKY
ncbi:hypothetical protein HHI36_020570 [Cryptolaemus montrouzieri]|uniref:Vesicle transport protein USE1 n=1 Tax=Cryptolaemus montrouzieri TaxID=559131 RepID=A0ABD2NAP7_9CUCU